jgi:hypothetical protein
MKNRHYLKLKFGRELTDREFSEITDIVEEELGHMIASDDVLEGSEEGMMCYCFEIGDLIENIEDGAQAIDIISYEIDQVIPAKIQWELETF